MKNEEPKAEGRNISFNPPSLLAYAIAQAKANAKAMKPLTNPSAVVCAALAEYKERNEPNDEAAAALGQIQAAIAKHGNSIAQEIVQFIRDRKRTRRKR